MQMTQWRKMLLLLCPLLASLCLAAGYLPSGALAAVLGLGALFAWLGAYRWQAHSTANLALVVSIAAAAIGVALSQAPMLMILSATLSLASWDLLALNFNLRNNPPSQPAERLETIHARYLILALGSGLLLALVGRLIWFQVPFVIMLLFVALAYFGLYRLVRYLHGAS